VKFEFFPKCLPVFFVFSDDFPLEPDVESGKIFETLFGLRIPFVTPIPDPSKHPSDVPHVPKLILQLRRHAGIQTPVTVQSKPAPKVAVEIPVSSSATVESSASRRPSPKSVPVSANRSIVESSASRQPSPQSVPVSATRSIVKSSGSRQPSPKSVPVSTQRSANGEASTILLPSTQSVPVTLPKVDSSVLTATQNPAPSTSANTSRPSCDLTIQQRALFTSTVRQRRWWLCPHSLSEDFFKQKATAYRKKHEDWVARPSDKTLRFVYNAHISMLKLGATF
jgi:hypothetical protein